MNQSVVHHLFVPGFANPAGSPIRELFAYLGRPGMISFAGGYPSPSLFDAEGLRLASEEAFASGAGFLQYGATEGLPALRTELLALGATRGLAATPEELLVTTGSQQAFDLLVRVFVQPGDAVLLETPAYPAAIQSLRLAGARLIEVPMDAQGLRTDALAALLHGLPADARPKLLYTVPTFSNPRGSCLPADRRLALVQLAAEFGFLVIEDDPYGELAFTGARTEPLHAIGRRAFGAGNPVIYLSSLSKTVAPALRIGWMLGHADVVRRCTVAKQTSDLCTSPLAQSVAANYLRQGRYLQTVAAACAEYRRRVQAMADGLRAQLGDVLAFDTPQGGMFLWAEARVKLDAKSVFDAAVAQGVLFVPGAAFFPSAHAGFCMRLSFAAPAVDEIRTGVSRLALAMRGIV